MTPTPPWTDRTGRIDGLGWSFIVALVAALVSILSAAFLYR